MSALDKNLKASANSKNPSTTFTLFNQPPDFGSVFNHAGKAANNPNGIAKANAHYSNLTNLDNFVKILKDSDKNIKPLLDWKLKKE